MKRQQRTKKNKAASHISPKLAAGQIRDVNNREVFKDPILCAQFLRNYTDISLLKDIQPEDIEDVSQKFQAYLGITFESDTVKRIRLKNPIHDNTPLYMISLIEHKSDVDYNISMQLLKYMVCIWHEYGKDIEKKKDGAVSRKHFKYPPILPIVYYEGAREWTADLHLKDRIMLSDAFGKYLPDFTYKLIRIHDYTNDGLLDKGDEMSLLMMINKAQTSEDIKAFWQDVPKDEVDKIIRNTPKPTMDVIVSVAWNLLMKLNVPVEEAEQYVEKIKEHEMGYWFENMEKMDIQAERRNTEKQRKRAEKAEKRADDAEKKLREKSNLEIKVIVSLCQKLNAAKETAVTQVMENTALPYAEASEKVDFYWENRIEG